MPNEKPANVPMKVRLVRHDGVNWYTDAEIGNEYEVLKVNILTYTIKTDDKHSTGLFKDHCEIIYPLPREQILTEEAWKERCRLLVLENDELMAENEMRKKFESFLMSVIRCKGYLGPEEDFEWFKRRMVSIKKSLEAIK